jgi:hypothetical protein
MREVTVNLGGHRYRVSYGFEGGVRCVHQQIVPMRTASYWRPLHTTSVAYRRAVEAAEAKVKTGRI